RMDSLRNPRISTPSYPYSLARATMVSKSHFGQQTVLKANFMGRRRLDCRCGMLKCGTGDSPVKKAKTRAGRPVPRCARLNETMQQASQSAVRGRSGKPDRLNFKGGLHAVRRTGCSRQKVVDLHPQPRRQNRQAGTDQRALAGGGRSTQGHRSALCGLLRGILRVRRLARSDRAAADGAAGVGGAPRTASTDLQEQEEARPDRRAADRQAAVPGRGAGGARAGRQRALVAEADRIPPEVAGATLGGEEPDPRGAAWLRGRGAGAAVDEEGAAVAQEHR